MNTFDIVDNFKTLDSIESRPLMLSSIPKPVISIAIPTYNRGRLIHDSLESALQQDVDFDYEVVVVDNDDTADSETRKYINSLKDPKLSYYQNCPNAGMVGNHNMCFKLCRADYVVILHDDDILLPFALKIYMKVLMLYPDAGLISSKDYIMINGIKPKIYIPKKVHIRKQKLIYNFVSFSVEEPSGTLYNKQKMIDIGGYNQEFYPCFDYSGAVLMISKYSVYTISEKLLIYRYEDNESLNPQTNLNSLIMDHYIIRDIGSEIGIPRCIINHIQSLKAANRLRLSKMHDGPDSIYIDGKVYKAGNKFTLLVTTMWIKFVQIFFFFTPSSRISI